MSKYYKIEEIRFKSAKSSGPGGQNVNKVNSAAHLYWDYSESACLSEEQILTISNKLAVYINRDDVFRLISEKTRDLEKNKQDCLKKLNQLLNNCFKKAKIRKKTKPTRSSQKKRVENKKQRGEIKKTRAKIKY